MDTTARDKVTDLLKQARTGMLTTMSAEGKHYSRPMALQEVEFDGDLWFFTFDTSNKIAEIKQNPEVNLSISTSNNTWISVTGTAEQVNDRAKAEELWNPLLKAWFADGLDTDGLTLIKLHAESAEYWDSASSGVVQLFGMAKAAITGQPAKGGENETVQL